MYKNARDLFIHEQFLIVFLQSLQRYPMYYSLPRYVTLHDTTKVRLRLKEKKMQFL